MCGSENVTRDGNIETCHDCHEKQQIDELRYCKMCGGKMKVANTYRYFDRRAHKSQCTSCSYRQIVYSQIISSSEIKFKQGQGFYAISRRLDEFDVVDNREGASDP